MDKLLSIICKQNQFIELSCNNCNVKNKYKTEELFENDVYETICHKCNTKITYDTTQVANDLKKAFKKLGVKLKH